MRWSIARLRGRPIVAVVRLTGVIGPMGPWRGGLSLAGLAPMLERAFSLGGIKAVALAINSPGGSPVQSSLIAKRIRALAAEKKLPAPGPTVAACKLYVDHIIHSGVPARSGQKNSKAGNRKSSGK